MTYTSKQGVTGIFQKIGQTTFLNGTVLFFKFKDNPDPGYSPQPVNRIAALGVKKDGSFGFLREIDFLSSSFPTTKSFETFITSTGKNTFVLNFPPFNYYLFSLLDAVMMEPVVLEHDDVEVLNRPAAQEIYEPRQYDTGANDL